MCYNVRIMNTADKRTTGTLVALVVIFSGNPYGIGNGGGNVVPEVASPSAKSLGLLPREKLPVKTPPAQTQSGLSH